MGIVEDRRTTEQVVATLGFVVATDSFMSGWGQAPRRSLFAVPFGTEAEAEIVKDNMERRSEMLRVRIVWGKHYRPKMSAGDHLSITDYDPTDRFHTVNGF